MRHLKAKHGLGSELSSVGSGGNGIIYKHVHDGIEKHFNTYYPRALKFIEPLEIDTEGHFDEIEIMMQVSHNTFDKEQQRREVLMRQFNNFLRRNRIS